MICISESDLMRYSWDYLWASSNIKLNVAGVCVCETWSFLVRATFSYFIIRKRFQAFLGNKGALSPFGNSREKRISKRTPTSGSMCGMSR